jgi:hypothetical protein
MSYVITSTRILCSVTGQTNEALVRVNNSHGFPNTQIARKAFVLRTVVLLKSAPLSLRGRMMDVE